MRQIILWSAMLGSLLAATACQETTLTPLSEEEKQAYSVGAAIGGSIKRNVDQIASVEESFDVEMFLQGLRDTIQDEKQLTDEELSKISSDFHQSFSAKHRAKQPHQLAPIR